MKTTIIFTALLFIMAFTQTRAAAATFTVTRSDDRNNPTCAVGDCSLREAVNEANTNGVADTITFAGSLSGITLANEIVIANSGALTITGPGANLLTIDGGTGTNRIFYLSFNSTAIISDLTLTGGNGDGATNSGVGGAILSEGSDLTLNRLYIHGNSASVNGGGGVYLNGATSRIRNSTFYNNSAPTGNGGGIIAGIGTVTIVNTTISGNAAGFAAGGLMNTFAATTLRNVTITGNSANAGGGVYCFSSPINFANTIIAGNIMNISPTNGPEIYDTSGGITSSGNNLVGDSPGDSTNTGMGTVTYQLSDIQNMNPMLGALTIANGGTTPTRALLAGSPAIDTGSNAQAIDPSDGNAPLRRDQRYYLRIADGALFGAIVDIGAYEFNATPTSATVSVGGRVTLGKGSLATRASVALTDMQGNVRNALVNPFGFYKFEDVPVGQIVTVQVSAKGATFAPQVVTVTEDIENLDFNAQ